MKWRSFALTSVAGLALALVSAQSIGMFPGGSPSLAAPCSFILIVPAFLDWPWQLILGLPVISFWLWSWQLFSGAAYMPLRSIILFSLVFLGSVVWFVLGWGYGLQFEGAVYTVGTLVLSLLLGGSVCALMLSCRRNGAFVKNLAAHWLAFVWMVTYAFPYLGETP